MEPLPEHLYEAITAEQLVIDIAALTDLTEDEVRQTGVQNNLVALHLAGNVPEHRQDLQRLAQGETMIRPSGPPVENATGPAAIDAALGINVSTGNVGSSANAKAGMPAPANAGMEPRTNGAPAPSAPVPNEPAPAAPAPSEQNAALNAAPWEARNLMNEPMFAAPTEQAWACDCGSVGRPYCDGLWS
eukprot:s5358_g4.t1